MEGALHAAEERIHTLESQMDTLNNDRVSMQQELKSFEQRGASKKCATLCLLCSFGRVA